jgi:hypothetical protein
MVNGLYDMNTSTMIAESPVRKGHEAGNGLVPEILDAMPELLLLVHEGGDADHWTFGVTVVMELSMSLHLPLESGSHTKVT